MKWMLLALLLTGCAARVPEPAFAGRYKNACLPEAEAMVAGLQEYRIPSRVLSFQTPERGHAIATYRLSSGSLWGWDSYWKSNRLLLADWSDPMSTARAWLNATRSREHLDDAFYP
jgi:hypothetical protein